MAVNSGNGVTETSPDLSPEYSRKNVHDPHWTFRLPLAGLNRRSFSVSRWEFRGRWCWVILVLLVVHGISSGRWQARRLVLLLIHCIFFRPTRSGNGRVPRRWCDLRNSCAPSPTAACKQHDEGKESGYASRYSVNDSVVAGYPSTSLV
jgi:hypothetical protein